MNEFLKIRIFQSNFFLNNSLLNSPSPKIKMTQITPILKKSLKPRVSGVISKTLTLRFSLKGSCLVSFLLLFNSSLILLLGWLRKRSKGKTKYFQNRWFILVSARQIVKLTILFLLYLIIFKEKWLCSWWRNPSC